MQAWILYLQCSFLKISVYFSNNKKGRKKADFDQSKNSTYQINYFKQFSGKEKKWENCADYKKACLLEGSTADDKSPDQELRLFFTGGYLSSIELLLLLTQTLAPRSWMPLSLCNIPSQGKKFFIFGQWAHAIYLSLWKRRHSFSTWKAGWSAWQLVNNLTITYFSFLTAHCKTLPATSTVIIIRIRRITSSTIRSSIRSINWPCTSLL